MTLNVFHYLNVTEKNIPLGIPYLKEIINNSKTTKNPSLTIYLSPVVRHSKEFAQKFAQSIRQKYLKHVILSDSVVFDPPPTRSTAIVLNNPINPHIDHVGFSDDVGTADRNAVGNTDNGVSMETDARSSTTTNIVLTNVADVSDGNVESTTANTRWSNVAEDEELVKLFASMPDFPELSGQSFNIPKSKQTEWSLSVVRLELDKQLLIKYEVTIEGIVKALREVFQDTIYIEYSSEYSERCILRIRSVIEKRQKILEGEDCALSQALLKYIRNHILIGGKS